jgi:hypothetical protein
VKKVVSGEEVFGRCWHGGEDGAGGCEENERGDGSVSSFFLILH